MNRARQAGLGRWLGAGVRFVATGFCLLILVALNRCASSSPTTEAPTATAEPQGSRPTATLIPTAVPTAKPTVAPPLPDLVVRHVKIGLKTGDACDYGVPTLGVWVVIENAGTVDSPSFVVQVNEGQQTVSLGLPSGQMTSLWFEGYAQSGENVVLLDADAQIEESDETNNSLSQMVPIPTLPPTCTPPPGGRPTETPTEIPTEPPLLTPMATAPPPQEVRIRGGGVTIPTYPYAQFTTQARNQTYNMTYPVLDRAAYEGSNPVPKDVGYRSVIVENEYLRLTFLPDLGGRLYEVLYKPTGHVETYRNPVLKPSPWGPPEQGWWLAAGGIEWCLPVEEHGYEWSMTWVPMATMDGTAGVVTMRDWLGPDRVRALITVRLEAGASYFTIRPRIENPTGRAVEVKYWTNAMLAPGAPNSPSADLRFVLPDAVTEVTIHSRGDERLPGYDERMSWPIFDGIDLSRLGNWTNWLGFFEDPARDGFVAVYDEGYDEGMVRVYPADVARGVKVFGLGWSEPIAAHNWTDDGSSYVEIHGGLAPTFGDSVTLAPGSHVEWVETWYPVAGMGGLRYANRVAALNLTAGGGVADIAVAVPRAWSGDVILLLNGEEQWRTSVTLLPGQPFRTSVPLGDGTPETGQLAVRLEGSDGILAAEYTADLRLK
jgi:hypothetical protein